MQVYIVRWIDAEPYEYGGGVHKVFLNYDDANHYVKSHQDGPYGVDESNYDYGYYIVDDIKCFDVE